MCKPNGRYEVIDGQGSKRLMALRLADYREAVADISVPKKEGVEAKVEKAEDRPSQERAETPKSQETSTPEKTNPTKEEGQSVNPTMARTSRDPASGPNSAKKSRNKEAKQSRTILKTNLPLERNSKRQRLFQPKDKQQGCWKDLHLHRNRGDHKCVERLINSQSRCSSCI